eukprot:1158973-Pelagomonas_calceolata.AAC.15
MADRPSTEGSMPAQATDNQELGINNRGHPGRHPNRHLAAEAQWRQGVYYDMAWMAYSRWMASSSSSCSRQEKAKLLEKPYISCIRQAQAVALAAQVHEGRLRSKLGGNNAPWACKAVKGYGNGAGNSSLKPLPA